jgi:hypothetical protein
MLESKKEKAEEALGDSERQAPTPYHNAAFSVFSYLLRKYAERGDVELIGQCELSRGPLKIDIVIIKKNSDVELEPAWSKAFRRYNLVEYKSPVDKAPTLAVFDKLMGYTRLYASQNEVKVCDMTATLVCAREPRKLFKALKEDYGYKILRAGNGIYYIREKGWDAEKSLAIQVVAQESEFLLRALDNKMLDAATVEKVAEFMVTEGMDNRELLGYWFEVMGSKEFKRITERMQTMKRTKQEVREILEAAGIYDDLLHEGELEGWQKGLEEEKRRTARAMLADGMDVATISRITGLAADEIQRL